MPKLLSHLPVPHRFAVVTTTSAPTELSLIFIYAKYPLPAWSAKIIFIISIVLVMTIRRRSGRGRTWEA